MSFNMKPHPVPLAQPTRPLSVAGGSSTSYSGEMNGSRPEQPSQTTATTSASAWRVQLDFGPGQRVVVRLRGQFWVPGTIVSFTQPRFEWQKVEYKVEYEFGGSLSVGLFNAEDMQRRC